MLTLSFPNLPVYKTVCGISRISKSELKAANFARAIAGYKLNESVFKEIEVNSSGYMCP